MRFSVFLFALNDVLPDNLTFKMLIKEESNERTIRQWLKILKKIELVNPCWIFNDLFSVFFFCFNACVIICVIYKEELKVYKHALNESLNRFVFNFNIKITTLQPLTTKQTVNT